MYREVLTRTYLKSRDQSEAIYTISDCFVPQKTFFFRIFVLLKRLLT
jgi:hypothetical protein